jgi:hypothetical protein
LVNIYWSNKKEDELLDFLASQHDKYSADHKVNGDLYFFIATIQYEKEDFSISKANFEKSKEIFKKAYEPNHKVFKVIDSYTNEIK